MKKRNETKQNETKQDKIRQDKTRQEREREREKVRMNERVYYCMLNVLTPFETNIDTKQRVIYTILCTIPAEGF